MYLCTVLIVKQWQIKKQSVLCSWTPLSFMIQCTWSTSYRALHHEKLLVFKYFRMTCWCLKIKNRGIFDNEL